MKRPIDPRRIEVVDPDVAAILRTKAPHEKVAMVAQAYQTARLLVQAQVMRTHPDWSEEQVQREVARRFANGPDGPPPVRPRRP